MEKYRPGELVWAKVYDRIYWPAKVTHVLGARRTFLEVESLGTKTNRKERARVSMRFVKPAGQDRGEMLGQSKSVKFLQAVSELDKILFRKNGSKRSKCVKSDDMNKENDNRKRQRKNCGVADDEGHCKGKRKKGLRGPCHTGFTHQVSKETENSTQKSASKNLKFGFIGLRPISVAIAAILLESGFHVMVQNSAVSEESVLQLAKKGATRGESSKDIIVTCDIIFMCPSHLAECEQVVLGGTGLATLMSSTKGLVCMSDTLDPITSEEIAKAVGDAGGQYLEVLVLGNDDGNNPGRLTYFAAGNSDLFAKIRQTMQANSRIVHFLGQAGNASRMHVLVCNLISGMTASYSECMAMAEVSGVSQQELLETVTSGLQQPDIVNREQIESLYCRVIKGSELLKTLKIHPPHPEIVDYVLESCERKRQFLDVLGTDDIQWSGGTLSIDVPASKHTALELDVLGYLHKFSVKKLFLQSHGLWNWSSKFIDQEILSRDSDVTCTPLRDLQAFRLVGLTDDVRSLLNYSSDMIGREARKLQEETAKKKETLAIPSANHLQLLKKTSAYGQLKEKNMKLEIERVGAMHSLVFYGPLAVIQSAKIDLLQCLLRVTTCSIELQNEIFRFVKQRGASYLDQFFCKQNLDAVTVDLTQGKAKLLLLTEAKEKVKEAVTKLFAVVPLRDIEDREVQEYLRSQDFDRQVRRVLMYGHDVAFEPQVQTLKEQRSQITLSVVGEKSDAQAIIGSLSKVIADYVVYTRHVRIKGAGRYRYLRKYRSADLKQLEEQFRRYKAKICFNSEESTGSASVVLQTTKRVLTQVQAEVQRIVNAPFDAVETIRKHGLMRFLDSEIFSMERERVERKHDVVVWVQGDKEDLDDDMNGKELVSNGHTGSIAVYTSKQYPDRRIVIFSEDICKHRSDAIVNAANEQLQHAGGVAGHIVQCAGGIVQKESTEYIQKNGCLKIGQAMYTTAGRLTTTKHIIHTVGPRWSRNSSPLQEKTTKDQLCLAVQSSLHVANNLNCRSVSLPAISSGIFGCPADFVAKHIVTAASSYLTENVSTSIREIHFLLLERDKENMKCFQQECAKLSTFDKKKNTTLLSPSLPSASLSVSGYHRPETGLIQAGRLSENSEAILTTSRVPNATFKLSVKPGDITGENVDAILNSTGSDLNLNSALASQAVSRKAGPNLQEACSRYVRTRGQLNDGDLFTTDSYGLPCKKVIHVVTPKDRAALKQLVNKSLLEAVRLGSRSVAIPALGTGNLGLTDSEAANGIFDGIDLFASEGLLSSIQQIDIVVFDQSKLPVFQQVERQRYAIDIKEESIQESENAYQLQNGVVLTIEQGDVTTDAVDVIVAPSGVVLSAVCTRSLQTKTNLTSPNPIADVVAGGDLNCNRVYAVSLPSRNASNSDDACVQAIRTVIDQCFVRANSSGYRSISIPAVGTGKLGYTNQHVAAAIIESATNFAITTRSISLKAIKISLFDSHRLPDFQKEAKYRIGKRPKTKLNQDPVKLGKRRALSTISSGEADDVCLSVTGDSRQVCEQALAKLQQAICRFCVSVQEPIEHEVPEGFDIAALKDMAARIGVGLQLHLPQQGEGLAMLILDGFSDDVNDAQKEVLRRLNKAMKDEKEALDRERILDTVTWFWKDECGTFRPYSQDSIVKLEIGLSGGKEKVQITERGKNFEVDVKKLQQTESGFSNQSSGALPAWVSVQRKVNSEDITDHHLDTREISFPKQWLDPRTGGQHKYDVHRHQLNPSDPEYQEAQKLFSQTGGQGTIISIERIQNPEIYTKYIQEKRKIEQKRSGTVGKDQVVRQLFHGTSLRAVDPIITEGFNRSFAGTARGKVYGAGVYFARNASYSCGYAKADGQGGGRSMFLCDVIIGRSTVGNAGMLEPPVINASVSATDKYDSTVNNTQNPSIFVSCYRDHMAYPSYLITFR